jgi:hypothetical protein
MSPFRYENDRRKPRIASADSRQTAEQVSEHVFA